MNIFKRSKSAIAKNSVRQQDPLPVPSSSSSRLPLLPQTNIDHQAAQPSISLADDASSSPGHAAFYDSNQLSMGPKISSRDPNDPNSQLKASQSPSSLSTDSPTSKSLAPSPRTSPRSVRTTYTAHSDMYTQNDLNTFSFGAAPSSSAGSSLLPPIDPLSRHRDEGDSDDIALAPDTTPRPSVVGNHSDRTHTPQSPGIEDWVSSFSPSRIKPAGRNHRPRDQMREPDSDTASTFGTSSASASVSSLTRPRGPNSRATSRVSGRSSETPQTSANDLTSDEEMDGRHPIPPGALDSGPHGYHHADRESTMYLSEEEFEGEDSEPDPVENDTFADETDSRGQYFNYAIANQDIIRAGHIENGRRGSLAMNIPTTPSDRSYLDYRARDNYSRRPSKSLEDLHSFSFAQATGPSTSGSRLVDNHPLPPAPTSVPESEGDWRDLRKRSVQRDKDLPPIFNSVTTMSPTEESDFSSNPIHDTAMGLSSDSTGQDFGLSWITSYGVNGVVGFDLSEMSDIIGASGPNGHRPSFVYGRKGSSSSGLRRHSTISNSNIDIMHKNILGIWASKQYNDYRQMWTFTRVKENSLEDNIHNRSNGGLEKVQERPSISNLFGSRPSTSTGNDLSRATSIAFFDKADSKDKDRSTVKEKVSKEPWKGMALDSEEVWRNGSSGRFKVSRKNATTVEQGKPPQQRLIIQHLRSTYPNTGSREPEGPSVTIHKHSKAEAFSISRHYRIRQLGPQDTSLSLRNTASSAGPSSSRDETGDRARKRTSMILLAPRRVQRAYTSTNTTRKLESHGLLDENGRTSPRDMERMKREDRERMRLRAKEKERERQRKGKGKEKAKEGVKDGDKIRGKVLESSSKPSSSNKSEKPSNGILTYEHPLPDSSEESSSGSVVTALSNGSDAVSDTRTGIAVPTPDQSEGSSSMGTANTLDPRRSVASDRTMPSDRTVSQNIVINRSHSRKRGVYDFDDDDDDDDDDDSSDERPRHPTRTPHSETYHTLAPSAIESAVQQHPSHGLFSWGKPRGGDRHGHRPNYLDTPYNPPWPVTQPRFNSDTRKGIVDDLNTSFQDVGLLPAMGEIKGSSHSAQHRRKHDQHQIKHAKRPADKNQTTDIFEEVQDALYMLLPLWPEETDAISLKKQPFALPPIPTQDRQYLLIYYKTPPAAIIPQEEISKTKSAEKKRSRETPATPSNGENPVFLSTFHISARIVSHRDLQGSGIRVPEVGLAVSGPLEDAFASMPSCLRVDDYVIGFCHSREAGIEFVPEGFEKMGLSRPAPNPNLPEATDDDDSHSFDTISILTPIGRAVMEMAWLGGMALTSFNPSI